MIYRSRGRRLLVVRRGFRTWFIAGCFVLIALLGIDGLFIDATIGGKAFGAILAIFCGGYAYVIWRTGNVVLYSRGVLVGTGLRSRWIEWGQIREISLENDRDLLGRTGHAPVIRLKSRRSVKLGFFFAPDGSRRDIALDVANAFNANRPSMDRAPTTDLATS